MLWSEDVLRCSSRTLISLECHLEIQSGAEAGKLKETPAHKAQASGVKISWSKLAILNQLYHEQKMTLLGN